MYISSAMMWKMPLRRLEHQLPSSVPNGQKRFYAIKVFERDEKLTDEMSSVKSYAEPVIQGDRKKPVMTTVRALSQMSVIIS